MTYRDLPLKSWLLKLDMDFAVCFTAIAAVFFPSLAATAFAAILFNLFLKRKSCEITAGKTNEDAADNGETARGASSTHTSAEGQGMTASSGYDYEVFLSFRGPDTRSGFTDFLYVSLMDTGIRVYRDNEELRVGEEIGPELLQAINQSKVSIPIFSRGYASSPWCLKELAQMVKCQKARGQKIMPIFYDVAPSEVRYQTGHYGKAFLSHGNKNRYDEETIREWKAALSAVGALKGWDLQSMPNRQEGEFAKSVTQRVFNELKKAYLVVSDYLVNVDHHVDEIMKMIGAQTNETRIIGIHGMGGIGKTTIAKITYNQLSHDFENCCFLSNIRETFQMKGVMCLQNQLISGILKTKWQHIKHVDEGTQTIRERLSKKRVLLLLDDVDEKYNMHALVGNHDWFGRGSKIIVTTRKKDVLNVPEVDCCYEVKGMDPDQSLQLFSKHAFRRDYPLHEYINQSKKATEIAGGLPLALEVIGSLLSCTKKEMWNATLKKLEIIPDAQVQSKLKISYDALDDRGKLIFLDIACFFTGYDKDVLVYFWDECKLFPEVAIEIMQNMSLIKITEDNKVWMHDQIRDLGRELVRQESKMKIEKQSRVWSSEEALVLLKGLQGKKKVEALRLKLDHQQQYCFIYEDFVTMTNLKFLEADGWVGNISAEERLLLHDSPSNVLLTENSYLFPMLQWLSLHDIPPRLNIANISMKNLVIVNLSRSEITHDWNGWTHMEAIKNLKVLDLTDCCGLERTPNFSAHANLKRLILRGCRRLVEIDGSICQLKRLVYLDIRNCRNLRRLPNELGGLEAMKELLIDSSGVKEIPNCQAMRNLCIFTASRCGITSLPLSIGELAALEHLSLHRCQLLKRLPDSIGNLESLTKLDISGTWMEELPNSMGNLKNLKVVKMTGSFIRKVPDALWTMEKLEEIEAIDNPHLRVMIGDDIFRSPSLRILKLVCKIYKVPRLPESLISLHLSELDVRAFPDLSNLINLKELYLRFRARAYGGKSFRLVKDPIPWWIGKLSTLESLDLRSKLTTLPTDINLLPQLKVLHLRCPMLRCLPTLPSSLLSLALSNFHSSCSIDLSNLKKLSSLAISSSAIPEIRGLDCLESLKDLQLSEVGRVEILPDLTKLNTLRRIQLLRCCNLVEIRGELPQSLQHLEICFCTSLQKLPHLSSLKGLQYLDIDIDWARN